IVRTILANALAGGPKTVRGVPNHGGAGGKDLAVEICGNVCSACRNFGSTQPSSIARSVCADAACRQDAVCRQIVTSERECHGPPDIFYSAAAGVRAIRSVVPLVQAHVRGPAYSPVARRLLGDELELEPGWTDGEPGPFAADVG